MGPHIRRSILLEKSIAQRSRARHSRSSHLLDSLEPRVLLSSTDPSGRPFPTGGNDNSASVFLSSSAQSSIYGAPVSLVARVLPGGAQSPNGILVDFFDIQSGTPLLLGTQIVTNNAATLTLSSACLGSHEIVAQIESGQSLLNTTSAPVSLTVSRASTQTLVIDSSGVVMAHVLSAATVSGGTVSFFLGTRPLATVNVTPDGVATCPPTAIPTGKHKIVAAYNGATNYTPSTSPAVAVQITPPAGGNRGAQAHLWTFSAHHGSH